MTLIQISPWTGWPNGARIELADDAAVGLFSAIAAYRSATGRHDADSAPIVAPVGGLRTVAECEEMGRAFDIYKRRASGSIDWALAMYAKYNMDKASNARPSTTSPHVSGYCADIAPNAFLNWMISNGTKYGWRRTLVASNDLRHFQFFPGTATAALNVTSLDGSTAPAPAPQKRDKTMDHWWLTDNNGPLYTLINHARREFCQTRNVGAEAGRATLWAVLYGNAVQINSAGNLAYGIQGYKSVAYPFAADPADSTPGAPVDFSPVLSALEALSAKDDASTQSILTAISQVDEATLATFGLRRA